MQPSHFCNWKHFSCHQFTLFNTTSASDHLAIRSWGQPPYSPAGTTARSSSSSTSNNLRGIWKAKHSPHAPAQDTTQAAHPRSGWRRRAAVLPPRQCSWQGHACLAQTPWTTAATQVCGCFCLPEAEEEGLLSFQEEMLLYPGVNVPALTHFYVLT